MKYEIEALSDRLRRSPTCYHAADTVRSALLREGYLELDERELWTLSEGGRYLVVRGDASLIAFRIPAGQSRGFHIAAAHGDSPCFKLKEQAEKQSAHYVQLSTEKYGGMLMSTWFDRPLSVAGRVIVRENGVLVSRLVDLDRDLLIIPSVAIHMNRSANEGMKYQANIDTLPLYGVPGCRGIRTLLAQSLGIGEDAILGSDLFLYCRDRAAILGAEGEFIAAPRLDDLMCAFGCLEGFLRSDTAQDIPVFALFDNEEVGSETKQGAASSFLRDTLHRIALHTLGGEEAFLAALARSFMVSADNAHALHPNHPEYADADNCPQRNGGIVIKFNANQRYATDGRSAAVFRAVCADAGVRTQTMLNRSDLPGGSTLGSIADTLLPVSTVDIGLAQLAMHSAYETAGSADYAALIRAMAKYFSADI